jgi:hypothetical protein
MREIDIDTEPIGFSLLARALLIRRRLGGGGRVIRSLGGVHGNR